MADGEFDNLTVNNVLTIGADTNLYRSATDTLKTNDNFFLLPSSKLILGHTDRAIYAPHTEALGSMVFTGHTWAYHPLWSFRDESDNVVIAIDSPSTIKFGADVNLYRSAANTLGTESIIESREYWQHLNPQQFMSALYNHTFTDTTGKIKFYDLNAGNNYILLHGVMSNGNPNLVCSQHLAVEKDLVVKGMLDSLEGEVALNGGSYGPEWGPDTRNPFIWLANTNYYTLEIRKKVAEGEGDWSYNHQYGQVWGWGDLACGTITSHDKLYLTGNTNGYLWNNGGYIRQSGGYGFVADGYLVVGTLSSGSSGPLYIDGYHRISYYSSSIRYKENIETAEDASWIYNLRPVNFDWKDPNRAKEEGRQLGLIAEEVNALCPQLTWLDSEGRPEGVHYEWLGVPLLVEVKKLYKRVEALENQLKQNPTAA